MTFSLYHSLRKPPILTVVVGAICSDGIALITDTKLTNIFGGKPRYGRKLFGDLKHMLMGYTGSEEVFDIFRKYVVGDVIINRGTSNCYTPDNSIEKIATIVGKINRRIGNTRKSDDFELLIAQHCKNNSRLYFINKHGKIQESNYKAIGSGSRTADMFCKPSIHNDLRMKEFTEAAYLSIIYMDRFPFYSVGVRPNGIPMMRYMDYTKAWDKKPPQKHIEEFSMNTLEELKKSQNDLNSIIKHAHTRLRFS
jgi:20S proteasome alpha/beta subunit